MLYRFSLIILSALAVCLCSVPAVAQVADLSGEWASSWGDVVLTPTKDGYEGRYETDNGRIQLRYTDSGEYEGQWSEDDAAVKCETTSFLNDSYYWGTVRAKAPTERKPFTIKWAYCENSDYFRNWDLTPKNISAPQAANPANSFVGNWLVDWHGSNETQAMVSIYKEYDWGCIHTEDNWCRESVKNDAPYLLNAGQMQPGDSGHPGGTPVFDGNSLEIEWNYYHLGHWGGESVLKLSGQSHASGKWEYGDSNGKETWKRVYAKVKYTGSTIKTADGRIVTHREPLGRPVTLSTVYVPPNYSMRGNRHEVTLRLYGENMWGKHHYFLPKESGLELRSFKNICANGGTESNFGGNTACTDDGGNVGMQLSFVVWSDARPGLKILEYDDQKIPFLLEVKDFPTPVVVDNPQTEISRVVLLDDQLSQRQAEGEKVKNYAYPFDQRGEPTPGLQTRLIAIVGKNLRLDGETYLASLDDRLEYERLALPDNIQDAINRAAVSLSGAPIGGDEEVIAVRARLKSGVRPGVKSFTLNGEKGDWGLLFAEQRPELSFLIGSNNTVVNSLSYQDVFKVRAVYKIAQTKQDITLELSFGDSKSSVFLSRLQDGRTYESAPLQLGLPELQNKDVP